MGPLISLCTTPSNKIFGSYSNIKFHFKADDTQVFVPLSHENASSTLFELNSSLQDIQRWVFVSK